MALSTAGFSGARGGDAVWAPVLLTAGFGGSNVGRLNPMLCASTKSFIRESGTGHGSTIRRDICGSLLIAQSLVSTYCRVPSWITFSVFGWIWVGVVWELQKRGFVVWLSQPLVEGEFAAGVICWRGGCLLPRLCWVHTEKKKKR